jgi:hypothetical protein
MKKQMLLMALAVAAILLWGTPALAFHDGGVADCQGCHTMHNSEDNAAITNANQFEGYDDLLLYPDKSDVCLRCHASHGSTFGYYVLGPAVLTPVNQKGAGDFIFLTEDNINDGHGGSTSTVQGYKAGHSIVSTEHTLASDPINTSAPGGTYPADDLGCPSCHDPHGTDAFRLTYKTGQTTTYGTSGSMLWNATIDATGISVFSSEGPTNHNAYRSGYSAWCGNCHASIHNSGQLIHPSGSAMMDLQVEIYNRYRGTTDCVNNPPAGGNPCGSGTATDAYLPEVPFEDINNDLTTRVQGAILGSSQVSCVTCHRAHATSAANAGRWDFQVTGLAEDGAESGSYTLPNPFDSYQRSLCNKCHAQDEFDTLVDFAP